MTPDSAHPWDEYYSLGLWMDVIPRDERNYECTTSIVEQMMLFPIQQAKRYQK